MSSTRPELALERLLLALEREVIAATGEELLAAARELGMNPGMKGSAAFFGILKHPAFGLAGTVEQKNAAGGLRRNGVGARRSRDSEE